jgi:hypothetical protein
MAIVEAGGVAGSRPGRKVIRGVWSLGLEARAVLAVIGHVVVEHPVHEHAGVIEGRAVSLLAGAPRWFGVALDPRPQGRQLLLEGRLEIV